MLGYKLTSFIGDARWKAAPPLPYKKNTPIHVCKAYRKEKRINSHKKVYQKIHVIV
jgi:hypothetical protein